MYTSHRKFSNEVQNQKEPFYDSVFTCNYSVGTTLQIRFNKWLASEYAVNCHSLFFPPSRQVAHTLYFEFVCVHVCTFGGHLC